MPVMTLYLDDRSFAALQRCAAAHGRSVEDLAEAAVSEAAIQNDPDAAPPRLPPFPTRKSTVPVPRSPTPPPPRSPEDGQRPRTPEDGRPVHTR